MTLLTCMTKGAGQGGARTAVRCTGLALQDPGKGVSPSSVSACLHLFLAASLAPVLIREVVGGEGMAKGVPHIGLGPAEFKTPGSSALGC